MLRVHPAVRLSVAAAFLHELFRNYHAEKIMRIYKLLSLKELRAWLVVFRQMILRLVNFEDLLIVSI